MDTVEREVFNPYKVLNLTEDASQKEVKSRFFSLSRAFHPDKQPPELFKESSQQFEKVELAYKILSTPMRKYVYDKYGLEGIKVCNDKAGKLGTLEEEYKNIVARYENSQEEDEIDEIKVKEAKAEMKLMQEKIRNNVEFYHRRLEEEHITIKYVKETSLSNAINLTDIVDFYIKGYPPVHSEQLKAKFRNIRPKVSFGSLNLHNWMVLPEYNGLQHMLGAFANTNLENNKSDFGFRYRFRKPIPQYKGLEFSGSLQTGDESHEGSLNVGKVFESGMSVSVGATMNSEKQASLSGTVNRMFADDFTWHTQGQYDGDGEFLTGISKEFRKIDLRLDSNVQVSKDKVTLTQSLSKPITKKLLVFASLNSFFIPAPLLQYKIGFTYKISSICKFSFSSFFVGQTAAWEFKFTRLGFKVRLPFNLNKHGNYKVVLFSLGVTGGLFYATYLYDKYRKRTNKHLKKLERKHRSRLMDGRRILNSTIGELHSEIGPRIASEIERNGVVVLKALYGYGPYIKNLYKKELRKWGYTKCFKAPQPANALLLEEMRESANLPERSEIIDVRVIIQNMVVHSILKISLEKLEQARGIYNPCFDENNQPWLLLVLQMNNKIFIRLLNNKGQKFEFSKDYDEFVMEANVERKYTIRNILSAI